MASFQQHLNISVIATGILIIPLHSANLLSTQESVIGLTLGFIGGMLPDLDSNHSKPTQIIFGLLSIFVPLLVLLSIPKPLPIVYMILLWFTSTLLLHYTLFKLFLTLTVHRGIFHTIPMGLLFGLVSVFLFHTLLHHRIAFASMAGFFLFYGFLSHLLLDEIYSIDARGMQIKKSFGTALKLYDKNNKIGTVILYLLLFVLFFNLPLDQKIYLKSFEVFKTIKLI